ncbi:unnamed protein product [Caenorhabditis auriculariae]|uniref:Uncharacterized protein n=1 Tax=Caenorhabditis auriculariae TaxID=2777116 RepID=A0A8S1H8Y6_9PELO|nr:unnamed protein product [Caenorhabditis auriculariae]
MRRHMGRESRATAITCGRAPADLPDAGTRVTPRRGPQRHRETGPIPSCHTVAVYSLVLFYLTSLIDSAKSYEKEK